MNALKRATRLGRVAPVIEREKWNKTVDKAREELQKVATETGYTQYYYYSYELSQTYYFNTGQQITGMNLLNGMMNEAKAAGDDYGMWQCLKYISLLYQRENDKENTRKYLLQVVSLRENSDDPLVTKQSLTRQCCDLADTYPVASDSARFYYSLAEKYSNLHLDTLRLNYYKAQLAAYDGERAKYRGYRDYCLADKSFSYLYNGGATFLRFIDRMLEGDPRISDRSLLDSLNLRQQQSFVSAMAVKHKAWDVAYYMTEKLYQSTLHQMSGINDERLDEVSAQYGNMALNTEIARQSRKITRITLLVAILLTIILVGALVFTWLHMNNLRKTQALDEKRIAELQEANEKVRLADAAKTRFVQNMSHEVRTPLNAIVGFSQLLSLPDGTFPEQEKEEFANHIVNNTKMLTMLLDDILNASSMDQGEYRIIFEDGECGFMCQEAITSAEHRLQPGVTMSYVPLHEGEYHVITDPRRVQQILINLLTNSCKHTSQGSITISYSLEENPGEVTFIVTDTGSGIPADQAEKIFERFTKLNEFVQGTGLGLSICRDIATRMGGRVFLDTSHSGGGSRFVFTIPVKNDEYSKTNNT